jgi:predicted transcriptional regulator
MFLTVYDPLLLSVVLMSALFLINSLAKKIMSERNEAEFFHIQAFYQISTRLNPKGFGFRIFDIEVQNVLSKKSGL